MQNLEMKISELAKRKIFLAVPMYGGMCHGYFANSLMNLVRLTTQYGIKLETKFLFNESLVTRARNYCVDSFIRSDYTHFMFIDSDIGFNALDVITMAYLMDPEEKENPKHIMCGPYPKKTIAWEKVASAVKAGVADADPNQLENFVGDYVINPLDHANTLKIDEPVKVREGGTGFMMITRHAFDEFRKAYPQNAYRPDHARSKDFDGSNEIHAYFDTVIDEKSKRYLSEDYMFCQWMNKANVHTWLCPWMKLTHTGSYTFAGSLRHLAAIDVPATVDQNQITKRN